MPPAPTRNWRSLCRQGVCAGVALGILVTVCVTADERHSSVELAAALQRAGERVERYFARAQSIVCLETVHLQPLDHGLTPDGFGRSVESELHLSWEPSADATPLPEARTLRQVLRINGRPPRRNDPDSCTSPEQNSTETQPLSMLLPEQRGAYTFSVAGHGRTDRRAAIMIDYKLKARASVEVDQIEGKEDCISFSVNGGMRGRVWLDAESYDVLRLDQSLSGFVDIPLPRKVARRNRGSDTWTMERWDSSMRFKPVAFQNPDEVLTLPITVSSLRVTRGSGVPRLRTVTNYSGYRRFLTGGRVVKE